MLQNKSQYRTKTAFKCYRFLKDIFQYVICHHSNTIARPQVMSDFSIEYILHRAGDRYLGTNYSLGLLHSLHRLLPSNSSTDSRQLSHNQQQSTPLYTINSLPGAVPVFDWLQYTRYHPPKLPRSLRQLGSAKRSPGRLPRIPFTTAQLHALEEAYRHSNYLSAEEANELAISLNLSNARVKIWFQNRRARERRDKRAQQQEAEIEAAPKTETILCSQFSPISEQEIKQNIENNFNLEHLDLGIQDIEQIIKEKKLLSWTYSDIEGRVKFR